MTTWQALTVTWDWEPSVLIGCLDLLAAYLLLARPLGRRAWLFGGGVLLLLLALVSPLDTLGDQYLFSAHMAQHMLLILAVPPLLVLGIPPESWEKLLGWAPAARAERLLARPPIAWLLGMCTFWLWHVPALYDAAVRSESLHIVQHLSFLVTSTIFWWPVITPCMERRIALLPTIVYLMAATFAGGILSVIISFAPPGLYPAYQHPIDRLGLLPLIRGQWGISYALDQQIGGLLMWGAGGPTYLLGSLWALVRWYREPEEPEAAESLGAA